MDVGPFTMDNFTEHSLLCHVEGGYLEKVVIAVFKLHTMSAGLLRSVHQLPAFIDRECSRYL